MNIDREFMVVTVLILVLIGFLTYNLVYLNRRNIQYPVYEPYTAPYNESDYPISLEEAQNIAIDFLRNEVGVNTSILVLKTVHGYRTRIAIKDGVIIVDYKVKDWETGLASIYIDSSTGRVVFLLMTMNLYPSAPCLVTIPSKDSAKQFVREFLEKMGYTLGDGIDIDIEKVDVTMDLFIVFELRFYGYRVWNPRIGGGALEACITPNDTRYLAFSIPFEALRVYELGLFIKPPGNLPISRVKASGIAVDYVKKRWKIAEYDYRCRGVYWYFKEIYNDNGRLVKDETGRTFYYPVPHLVYIFDFKITPIHGSRFTKSIYVDAINGEVGVLSR